ncbi:MAG: 50S ribosomal protein L23 [Rickettsiales bacterium]|jgi:large subunit ribosomal protein L23|nr:50S ribosomal protein L23 [Rickettsiales bacterium]
MANYDIIVCALTTEKTSKDIALGKYAFIVVDSATKDEIKKVIEELFDVSVDSVNISNYDGKIKRYKGKIGQRKATKKAIVSLKKGETLDFNKLEGK